MPDGGRGPGELIPPYSPRSPQTDTRIEEVVTLLRGLLSKMEELSDIVKGKRETPVEGPDGTKIAKVRD